jgi:hypothetical protein
VGSLAALRRGGRSPFARTSHGQLPASSESVICYLTFAYFAFALAAAAAATVEGSAKAITASPSVLIVAGLPPKG